MHRAVRCGAAVDGQAVAINSHEGRTQAGGFGTGCCASTVHHHVNERQIRDEGPISPRLPDSVLRKLDTISELASDGKLCNDRYRNQLRDLVSQKQPEP